MTDDDASVEDQLRQIADEFGREYDPLKKYSEKFKRMEEKLGIDPFEMFLDDVVRGTSRNQGTIDEYERAIDHYKTVMRRYGRHPACPHDEHVESYIEYEMNERGNEKSTVQTYIIYINKAYKYLQGENSFPHSNEFNPFNNVREDRDWDEVEDTDEKDYPRITIEEMRDALDNITHVMKLTMIMMGLKLGMRQGEIRNLQLQDIHITNSDLQRHYPSLGSHRRLDRLSNAIYIPTQYKRSGNKSKRPRVLPLDDEMRRVLTRYLLVRPDCGEPYVFVSRTSHEHIRDKDGINRHWREQMRPQFETADYHDELTSHFGRHWFTSYWKIDREMERELVEYMRGDIIGKSTNRDSIDEYLNAYYLDIEDRYREEIYKLRI